MVVLESGVAVAAAGMTPGAFAIHCLKLELLIAFHD